MILAAGGVVGFAAGDEVVGVPFYLDGDLALLAVVVLIGWVVADDVAQV